MLSNYEVKINSINETADGSPPRHTPQTSNLGVFVHVGPVESIAVVGRVVEVIDGEAFLAEAFDHILIVGVSPAGGDIDHRPELNEFLILHNQSNKLGDNRFFSVVKQLLETLLEFVKLVVKEL